MRIFYIAKFSDIHSEKWVRFFENEHEVYRYNVDGFKISHIWKARKAIKCFKPDIVHAHYMGVNGLIAALSGFHPFIGTVHGSEVLLTTGIRKRLVRWVLSKADLITTDGYHVERKMQREMGGPLKKIQHVNFGVDCEKFKPRQSIFIPMVIMYRVGSNAIYDTETVKKCREVISDKNIVWQPIKKFTEKLLIYFLQCSTLYVSTAISNAGLSSTTASNTRILN